MCPKRVSLGKHQNHHHYPPALRAKQLKRTGWEGRHLLCPVNTVCLWRTPALEPSAERERPGRQNSKAEMRWGKESTEPVEGRNQGTKKSCKDGTLGEKKVGSGREERGKSSSTLWSSPWIEAFQRRINSQVASTLKLVAELHSTPGHSHAWWLYTYRSS